jgi:hypothetical protein
MATIQRRRVARRRRRVVVGEGAEQKGENRTLLGPPHWLLHLVRIDTTNRAGYINGCTLLLHLRAHPAAPPPSSLFHIEPVESQLYHRCLVQPPFSGLFAIEPRCRELVGAHHVRYCEPQPGGFILAENRSVREWNKRANFEQTRATIDAQWQMTAV